MYVVVEIIKARLPKQAAILACKIKPPESQYFPKQKVRYRNATKKSGTSLHGLEKCPIYFFKCEKYPEKFTLIFTVVDRNRKVIASCENTLTFAKSFFSRQVTFPKEFQRKVHVVELNSRNIEKDLFLWFRVRETKPRDKTQPSNPTSNEDVTLPDAVLPSDIALPPDNESPLPIPACRSPDKSALMNINESLSDDDTASSAKSELHKSDLSEIIPVEQHHPTSSEIPSHPADQYLITASPPADQPLNPSLVPAFSELPSHPIDPSPLVPTSSELSYHHPTGQYLMTASPPADDPSLVPTSSKLPSHPADQYLMTASPPADQPLNSSLVPTSSELSYHHPAAQYLMTASPPADDPSLLPTSSELPAEIITRPYTTADQPLDPSLVQTEFTPTEHSSPLQILIQSLYYLESITPGDEHLKSPSFEPTQSSELTPSDQQLKSQPTQSIELYLGDRHLKSILQEVSQLTLGDQQSKSLSLQSIPGDQHLKSSLMKSSELILGDHHLRAILQEVSNSHYGNQHLKSSSLDLTQSILGDKHLKYSPSGAIKSPELVLADKYSSNESIKSPELILGNKYSPNGSKKSSELTLGEKCRKSSTTKSPELILGDKNLNSSSNKSTQSHELISDDKSEPSIYDKHHKSLESMISSELIIGDKHYKSSSNKSIQSPKLIIGDKSSFPELILDDKHSSPELRKSPELILGDTHLNLQLIKSSELIFGDKDLKSSLNESPKLIPDDQYLKCMILQEISQPLKLTPDQYPSLRSTKSHELIMGGDKSPSLKLTKSHELILGNHFESLSLKSHELTSGDRHLKSSSLEVVKSSDHGLIFSEQHLKSSSFNLTKSHELTPGNHHLKSSSLEVVKSSDSELIFSEQPFDSNKSSKSTSDDQYLKSMLQDLTEPLELIPGDLKSSSPELTPGDKFLKSMLQKLTRQLELTPGDQYLKDIIQDLIQPPPPKAAAYDLKLPLIKTPNSFPSESPEYPINRPISTTPVDQFPEIACDPTLKYVTAAVKYVPLSNVSPTFADRPIAIAPEFTPVDEHAIFSPPNHSARIFTPGDSHSKYVNNFISGDYHLKFVPTDHTISEPTQGDHHVKSTPIEHTTSEPTQGDHHVKSTPIEHTTSEPTQGDHHVKSTPIEHTTSEPTQGDHHVKSTPIEHTTSEPTQGDHHVKSTPIEHTTSEPTQGDHHVKFTPIEHTTSEFTRADHRLKLTSTQHRTFSQRNHRVKSAPTEHRAFTQGDHHVKFIPTKHRAFTQGNHRVKSAPTEHRRFIQGNYRVKSAPTEHRRFIQGNYRVKSAPTEHRAFNHVKFIPIKHRGFTQDHCVKFIPTEHKGFSQGNHRVKSAPTEHREFIQGDHRVKSAPTEHRTFTRGDQCVKFIPTKHKRFTQGNHRVKSEHREFIQGDHRVKSAPTEHREFIQGDHRVKSAPTEHTTYEITLGDHRVKSTSTEYGISTPGDHSAPTKHTTSEIILGDRHLKSFPTEYTQGDHDVKSTSAPESTLGDHYLKSIPADHLISESTKSVLDNQSSEITPADQSSEFSSTDNLQLLPKSTRSHKSGVLFRLLKSAHLLRSRIRKLSHLGSAHKITHSDQSHPQTPKFSSLETSPTVDDQNLLADQTILVDKHAEPTIAGQLLVCSEHLKCSVAQNTIAGYEYKQCTQLPRAGFDKYAQLPRAGFDKYAQVPRTGFDKYAQVPRTGFDKYAQVPRTGFDKYAQVPRAGFDKYAQLPRAGFDKYAQLPRAGIDESVQLPRAGIDESAQLPRAGFDQFPKKKHHMKSHVIRSASSHSGRFPPKPSDQSSHQLLKYISVNQLPEVTRSSIHIPGNRSPTESDQHEQSSSATFSSSIQSHLSVAASVPSDISPRKAQKTASTSKLIRSKSSKDEMSPIKPQQTTFISELIPSRSQTPSKGIIDESVSSDMSPRKAQQTTFTSESQTLYKESVLSDMSPRKAQQTTPTSELIQSKFDQETRSKATTIADEELSKSRGPLVESTAVNPATTKLHYLNKSKSTQTAKSRFSIRAFRMHFSRKVHPDDTPADKHTASHDRRSSEPMFSLKGLKSFFAKRFHSKVKTTSLKSKKELQVSASPSCDKTHMKTVTSHYNEDIKRSTSKKSAFHITSHLEDIKKSTSHIKKSTSHIKKSIFHPENIKKSTSHLDKDKSKSTEDTKKSTSHLDKDKNKKLEDVKKSTSYLEDIKSTSHHLDGEKKKSASHLEDNKSTSHLDGEKKKSASHIEDNKSTSHLHIEDIEKSTSQDIISYHETTSSNEKTLPSYGGAVETLDEGDVMGLPLIDEEDKVEEVSSSPVQDISFFNAALLMSKFKDVVEKMGLEIVNIHEDSSFLSNKNMKQHCRQIGVQEAALFDSEGLMLTKNNRRMILCLLDVVSFSDALGIHSPHWVHVFDKTQKKSHKPEKPLMDDNVLKKLWDCRCTTNPLKITSRGNRILIISGGRVKGEKIIYIQVPKWTNADSVPKLQLFSNDILVRVGGGWEPLNNFLLDYDPCKAPQHPSESIIPSFAGEVTIQDEQTSKEEERRYWNSLCPFADMQGTSFTTKLKESMKMMGLEILNMKADSDGSLKKWGVIRMTSHDCNISWSWKTGVEEAVIFGSLGLTLEKDKKKLLLCYLDVVCFTKMMGISPPKWAQINKPPDTCRNTSWTLEERVLRTVRACQCLTNPLVITSEGDGIFVVSGGKVGFKKRLFTRGPQNDCKYHNKQRRQCVRVRVGGGWVPLDKYLLEHDPCRIQKFISVGSLYGRICFETRVLPTN